MDTLDAYQQTIENILREYARIPYSHGSIQQQVVIDRASDHYLLMLVGHDGIQRVHGSLIHVDIIDGRFWIQRDGTEYGIARELLDAGIPKADIILSFRAQEAVPLTDIAYIGV